MAPKRRLPIEETKVCINEKCIYHNKTGSIVRVANSGKKNILFGCRECNKRYSSTYGTIFHKKHTNPEKMIQVLMSLAEGNTIRGAGRIFGVKKDTVVEWLKIAGKHCEEFEKEVVGKFNFNQVQLDELWSFIVKKTTHPVVRKEKSQKQQN